MILNHKAAIEFWVENAQEIAFNRYTTLGLHALLSENLLQNPDDEGRLRTRPITVGTSVYVPTEIPQVIEERFDTILGKATAIPDPFEQSFFVMVHLPYLQPFIDVNKRTSRLAANIPFIQANVCPLSFVDVPERTYYRMQLRALVGEIVRDRIWPDDDSLIERAAAQNVPEKDRPAVAKAARNDLRRLRPDILARYQLRHSEFVAWLHVVEDARRNQLNT